MADRVVLRSGSALSPPGFMRRGELAYSPQDFRLWIGDNTGTAQPVFDAVGAGGGGGGLTSFQGRATAAAVLISGDVTGALGFTPGTSSFDGAYASLTGKPTLFDGAYASLTGKPTLFDGTYASLTGKPTLATVASSGVYTDLTSRPTLGGAAALNVGTTTGTVAAGDDSRIVAAQTAAQVSTAIAAGTAANVSGIVAVVNGGTGATTAGAARTALGVSTVGNTGAYTDLTGKPTLGGAAALSVGTTTGTVAAGDDSRITGALSATTAASTYAPLASPTLSGTIALGSNTTAAIVGVNGPSASTRALRLQTAGASRWLVLASNTAESGSNVGSDFAINRYDDTGTFVDSPFIINRASGLVGIALLTVGTLSVTNAAAARTSLGLSAFAWDVNFDQGAVVANGTITVVRKAPFACTINSLDYEVGSAGGSFTVAVQIAGVSVTGLSAVAVSSSTSANAAASGANTVAAGQAVTLVISSVAGSPTGANLQINGTR